MKLIAQVLMVEKKKLNDNPTSTTFWTERKKKKISCRNLIHNQSTASASLAEWSLDSNFLRLENDVPIMGSMWKLIYMVYIGSEWPLQLYNKYLWYHISHY